MSGHVIDRAAFFALHRVECGIERVKREIAKLREQTEARRASIASTLIAMDGDISEYTKPAQGCGRTTGREGRPALRSSLPPNFDGPEAA